MLVEAQKAGLLIEQANAETVLGRAVAFPNVGLPAYVEPDQNAELHNSLDNLGWWTLEYLPHIDPHKSGKGWYIPKGRRRTIPPGSWIHESVMKKKNIPPGIPDNHRIEQWVPF